MRNNDESFMHSGFTSEESLRVQSKKRERRAKKSEVQSTVLPFIELIHQEIDKEREDIAKSILDVVHVDMTENAVKATVLGLRQADARLLALRNRFDRAAKQRKLQEGKNE